ncbi:F-box associated ubiquitination effector family protein [Raphanus sativus]|uniref:F-box protein At1g53360 n=1 Tax=Raphanus sativus TaxID=3726 RepID=A0A6J0KLK3_RAPSA|nr:putative F-box protein At1g53360 [Raphanus sativus]KAJ4880852.1 F-box associated ubiquitination effector family protein [Raphanus sativus]
MKNLDQQSLEGLISITSRHETQSSNSVREYSSDPQIPDDLLITIFSLVPAESIARFRCVSKTWASILRRSDFTELFLTKSLTRPRLFVAVKSKGKLFFHSSPQPHNLNNNYSLVATSYHPTFVPDYCPTYICKPVFGLVLLQRCGIEKRPMICNPAKGKVRNLPEVPRKGINTPKGIYLGYDPIGKQFKVLCLSMNTSLYNTHWILTLEYGECSWRSLEPEFNFKEKRSGGVDRDINICINGVLYFEGCLEWSFVIVWFDVRSEKFGFINKNEDMLPKPFAYDCTRPSTLFNYKDKLGIHCRVERNLVLWVLEDAGNHKWYKHSYVLPPRWSAVPTECMFVGMTSTGEIVYSWNSCVYFYNLERDTVKRVNIHGLEGIEHPTFINTFVDYAENMNFM